MHEVTVSLHSTKQFELCVLWCCENIGEPGDDWDWYTREQDLGLVFRFLNAASATWFQIVWG